MRDELTYLGPYSRCLLLLLLLVYYHYYYSELLFFITYYDQYYYCLLSLSLSLRRRDYLSQAFKEALALAFQWL